MRKSLWLFIGILVFAVMQIIPTPGSLTDASWDMLSVTALMTILWITESIELGITALLPIVLFPILGITPFAKVTLQYANETIFLFMGGFMLALALEKSRIHERFALHCIRLIGGSPTRVILGFMLVIFLLSMWVSNTAAVLMIIPVCIAVVHRLEDQMGEDKRDTIRHFSKALYLSLAYAASIGGIATLIGTPPNIVLASIVSQQAHIEISFVRWLLFAFPFALILLIIVWLFLSRIVMPKEARKLSINTDQITSELDKLGAMSTHEKRVAIAFGCVVILWIVRGLIDIPIFTKISDTTVAIAGAIALFMIPCQGKSGDRLLDWKTASRLPWNILLLFGGGLALSQGFASSGLSATIVDLIHQLRNVNIILLIAIIAFVTVAMTELMSNTATATLLIPIGLSIAAGLSINPLLIAVPVAISASLAFMLPISTPPNAIVFSYGYISIKEMACIGIAINLLGLVLTTLFCYFVMPLIL
jgi:sodium-dependent dicarboxylate transporter 2/3/5